MVRLPVQGSCFILNSRTRHILKLVRRTMAHSWHGVALVVKWLLASDDGCCNPVGDRLTSLWEKGSRASLARAWMWPTGIAGTEEPKVLSRSGSLFIWPGVHCGQPCLSTRELTEIQCVR